MVAVHAMQAGEALPRITQDADIVVDIRLPQVSMQGFVAILHRLGFELAGASGMDVAHRFIRDEARIDVLAPDHLGQRADLTTVPPGRTLEISGGRRALDRTRRLEVTHLGRGGWLFLPDLLGAISVKAAALLNTTDREGECHAIDLALLLGLLDDPFETREALATSDRQLLLRASMVLTATHPAWNLTQRGTDARLALEILVQAS